MPAGQSRSAVIQWQKNVKKQGGCKVHVTHSYAARLSAALRHAPVLHHGRRIHCRPVRPAELCCGHGRPNRAGRARQVRGWPDRHPVLRRLWRMPAALRLLRRQDLTQKAHFYRCAGLCHPKPGDGPFRRLLSGHAGAVDGKRHLPILPMVAGGARLLGDDPAQLPQARLRKRRDDLPHRDHPHLPVRLTAAQVLGLARRLYRVQPHYVCRGRRLLEPDVLLRARDRGARRDRRDHADFG